MAGNVEAPEELDTVALEEPVAGEEDLVFCVVCEPLDEDAEFVGLDWDADEPELLLACVAEEPGLLVADDAEEDCVSGGRLVFCAATFCKRRREEDRRTAGASRILCLICIVGVF